MTPSARFDDLRPRHRRGFALGPITRVISTSSINEVANALVAAEAEVAAGRWVAGWVGYEAAPAFDSALTVRPSNATDFEKLPLVWLAVSDRRTPAPAPTEGHHRLEPWVAGTSARHHHDSVEAIRSRILAGDTYQVNHTFLMRSRFSGDPAAFYQELTRSQSCGYGALIDAGDWVVVSASPELFFEWRNGVITCRPMKGTARRGVDGAHDEALRAWLEASEKNRAENLMIVDMVRNDVGRIARTGTVRVPALFATEKYDTVWQLTSTVTARPIAGIGLSAVFAALFPSASITGAPKVAATKIITETEPHPRGVYCGAIGFGGPGPEGPEWTFNVGIRTVLINRPTGVAYYGTGGGITYDSEATDEYAEALLKAEVLSRGGADLRLLETTRWDPRLGARHLDRHLERAASSAAYFDIPFDTAEVRAAIGRAVKGMTTSARLRVLVDRAGWVTVEAGDLPDYEAPVRLALDDRPVDSRDPLLRHKTTLRRVYDEALARHPEVDDVILWNDGGELTETTIGNLALQVDGHWLTPPLTSGLLAGTERAARLASGELTERALRIDDLGKATGLARLNSVRGWEEAELVRAGTDPDLSPGDGSSGSTRR